MGSHLSREQVDDLEAVLHNPDGHQLLAVVASVHHQRVVQALDDGALGIAETLGGVAAGAVRHVLGKLLLHGDVVLKERTHVNKKAL